MPNIIGLNMEKGKKVNLREDISIRKTFPMNAPNAVRVWMHFIRPRR